MKKAILFIAAVAVLSASCTTYTCPTYSMDVKEQKVEGTEDKA
jgi:hypothetical protein